MAAPWQGLPVRLERAPHRGAAFALSNASKRRIRSIGSRSGGSFFIGSRSRGSLFIFRSSPAVAPPASVTHSDSRFRRVGSIEGVFYAAETDETAVAEAVFHRLLFYYESPNTPRPANPGEYTAFAAEFATGRALDLCRPPLVEQRASWTHHTDYVACLALTDIVRAAALEAIR